MWDPRARELAVEAVQLRQEIKEKEDRLRLISAELAEQSGSSYAYTDSGVRRFIEVRTRKTWKVDADKLSVLHPALYERCKKVSVDTRKIGELIDAGRVPDWERFAERSESRPFVQVTEKKVLGDDSGEFQGEGE